MKRRDFCKALVCSAALAPGLALPRAEAAAKSQTVGRAVPAGIAARRAARAAPSRATRGSRRHSLRAETRPRSGEATDARRGMVTRAVPAVSGIPGRPDPSAPQNGWHAS